MRASETLMRAPETTARITLRDLLYVIFKNQRSVLIILAVALTGAGAYLLFADPTYKAEASVLIKLGKDEMSAIESIPREQSNYLLQQRGQIINNEIEILRSPAIVHAVAPSVQARIDADAEAAAQRSWIKRTVRDIKRAIVPIKNDIKEALYSIGIGSNLTREQEFLIALAKRLKIEAVEEAEVIRLIYADENPERAAFIANAFLDSYLMIRLNVHGNDQSGKFYGGQIETLHSNLLATENQITRFMKDNNITNLALQKDLLVHEISELEKSQFQVERSIAESRLRKQEVLRAAKDRAGVVPATSNRTSANYSAIDEAYFKLANDLAKLETEYNSDAREVTDVAEQQMRLKTEKSVSVGRTIDGDLAVQIKGYSANDERLNHLKSDLARLNAATFTLAELEGTRDTLRTSYQLYRKKAEEFRVSTDLDRNQITSVKTLTRAYPPLLPASPKPLLVFGLAFVISLFLSFAYVVIAEFFNHTFRDDRDVSEHLGLPTLGSVKFDPTLPEDHEARA
jgi:uncharacterized protein involved in exopolysaccharide biosynthesis